MSLQVTIFKGKKKPGYYLFVSSEDLFAEVPPKLLLAFGELVEVMEIELVETTKLAVGNATDVLTSIDRDGYHLQMPQKIDPVTGEIWKYG
ncbi:MAG: hypothetical protein CMD74_01350 [Gammaproteobacteria bacterium]|nr:hypothetical protein [Gammaproteobacteria bacterium]